MRHTSHRSYRIFYMYNNINHMKKYVIKAVVYTVIFFIILSVMWKFLLDESFWGVIFGN